jgi:uncharacterized RDD family membrane protein YckC
MYTEAPRASLLRRLSAIMYDLLVICAIWMFAMALALAVVALLAKTGLISLAGYQDEAEYIQKHALWFQLYSTACILWFYLYFWVKAGQTLGMRAWRMLLLSADGTPVTLRQACIRLLTSFGGLGNFWLWLRWGKGLALQDQIAGTIVVVLSKEQSSALNLHRDAR